MTKYAAKQSAEFFMSHPLRTGLCQVGDGLLQCAVLGEARCLTGPQTTGIELSHFGECKEGAGVIVAGEIAMLRKSSQARGSGAMEGLAELW